MLILIIFILWIFKIDKEIYFINWEVFNKKNIIKVYYWKCGKFDKKLCDKNNDIFLFVLLIIRI